MSRHMLGITCIWNGNFAGPLQDTIVQRWRDPVDGTVCYLYLPISAQHSPPTPSGFVQYGARPDRAFSRRATLTNSTCF